MFKYAVCEIAGKQYRVVPDQPMEIDWQGTEVKEIQAKVLFMADDKKSEVGTPYLKDELTLEVSGEGKKRKIRVSKFHAKANYRRVIGSRAKFSKVIYGT